jgi:DNA-nicking Smr family endonuclease
MSSCLDAIFGCYASKSGQSMKSVGSLVYKGTRYFPSSSKNITTKALGVNSGDTFIVSPSCPSIPSNDDEPNAASTTKAEKKTKAVSVRTSEQRKPWAGVIDTDNEDHHKKVHSSKMELVWKEAEPKFEVIRKELNDLTIKRTKPKVRSKSEAPQRIPFTPLEHNVDSVGLGTKAGKWSYKVLVGSVDNLYKTSKKSSKTVHRKPKFTLDLHGHTAEQALGALNINLQNWNDTAMKSNHPYVIQVEIICGKGGQVLSEVVEKWVKSQNNVANAPKSKY